MRLVGASRITGTGERGYALFGAGTRNVASSIICHVTTGPLEQIKQAALGSSHTCRGTYARLSRQYKRRTMASLASAYSSAVVTLWVTCASRSRAPSAVLPPAPPPEPFVAGPGTPAGVSQAHVGQVRLDRLANASFPSTCRTSSNNG